MTKQDNGGGGVGEKTLIKNMSFDDIVYSITKALKEKTYLKENDAYYFDIDTPSASTIFWRGNLSEDKQWSIYYGLANPNFVYLSIEDKRFRAGNIDDVLATIKIHDDISSRYYTNGFSELDIRNKLYFVYRDKMRKWNKDLDSIWDKDLDKFAGGGGVESLLDQRKELLEELINSDIIDEEHGYYDDVKGAIESNDSEQMREIIDELLSSGLIYKDDWDYKLARKLSKEGKKFDLGGSVDDSDDYGTFEIYKNGGSIEVNVVNSDKKYNEKEYDWILGDKDKDGVANADDTKPLDKTKSELIDTPSITTGIKSLISLKKSLDSTMFSFIDDLKNVAPDNSKIYARTKTPYSVLDKLIKKRLSTITDLIGTTIVTSDKKELDSVKKYIDSGKLGKIIELEDMYKNPKGGYRAYHYLIERNGMSIELQLKTKRQKALNELSHEPYKLGKINSALLLKITEIANRADEGDKGAINEYNEFMKTPNIENVFYAEKMSTGGGVRNYKEKNETMDKMNKYRTGGEVYSDSKWLTKNQWEKWNKYVKTGKIDDKKENNIFAVARWIGVPVESINAYEIEKRDKKNKYAVGGEVGNQVSFKGDYGTPRSGIVKEKRGSSYIVATENGDRLVDSYEVISFSEAPMEKKKRFGFFEGGGSIGFKERSERDSIKLAKAYQKVFDSNFEDKEYNDYEKIVKETQIPKEELQKIEHYISTTPKGQQRMIDIYRYWGVKYEGGGEIEGKISDLQAVVDGDFPQFAKDKAKAEIEKLEKELHESKETKAEEKEEHKTGGYEAKKPKFKIGDVVGLDLDERTPKMITSFKTNRKGEIIYSGYYIPFPDQKWNYEESEIVLLKTPSKSEAKKPTTRKAPVRKAADKEVQPQPKFKVGERVVDEDYEGNYEILEIKYAFNPAEGKPIFYYNLNGKGDISSPEYSLKKYTKPKADHKKLLAKIKAKKGEKEYSNKASLVPFTDKRRKRSESSDRKREALPLGKRVSADGNTYYENRLNRADISKEDKFEGGGSVDNRVLVVLDEGYGKVINNLFNQWNNVKTEKQYNSWIENVKKSKFGTYGTISINEVLEKFEFDKSNVNSVKKSDFKKEINNALKKFAEGGEIKNSGWGLKFLKW